MPPGPSRFREKGLAGEHVQVWPGDAADAADTVFEKQSALVLERALEAADPGTVVLPRVIKNGVGRGCGGVAEAVFGLSDGGVVFLESKYGMSKVSSSR